MNGYQILEDELGGRLQVKKIKAGPKQLMSYGCIMTLGDAKFENALADAIFLDTTNKSDQKLISFIKQAKQAEMLVKVSCTIVI